MAEDFRFAAIPLCGTYIYWLSVLEEGAFLFCFDVCLIFAAEGFENDRHSRPAHSAQSLAKTQL